MNWFVFFKYTFAGILTFFLLSFGGIASLTSGSIADTPAVSVAHAQEDTTYTFMQNVNLPAFGGDDNTVNISEQSLAEFVNTLIQLTIGFAILLAIIMVIAAGAQYMLAGSVTKKSNAQKQIGKAVGGLFLALSAVVILQTINPNLIELDPLEEVNVDAEDISGVHGVDYDVKNPDNGYYACFWEYTAVNEEYCYEDINECEENYDLAASSGEWDVDYDVNSCTALVFYEGARANAEEAQSCYASFKGSDPTNSQYNVQCFSSEQDCNENRSQAQNINEIPDPETQCKPPAEFGSGNINLTYESSGIVVDPDENELTAVTGTSTQSKEEATQQCINNGDDWIANNKGDDGPCPDSSGPQSPECKVKNCGESDDGNGGSEDTYVYTATGEVVKNGTTLTEVSSTSESTSETAAKEQAKSKCNQEATNWIENNTSKCPQPSDCEPKGCDAAETSSPDDLVSQYIINGSPPESDVRERLWNQNPTIFTNRGNGPNDPRDGNPCESVNDTACTNLGGLSQAARNGLRQFNQDFTSSPQCSNTDCNLMVTGGTSWWFHGDRKKDPLDQVGETYHNPVGIDPDLGTGAIDLSKMDGKLKNYIQNNGCEVAGNSYQLGKHYFLNEFDPPHWHVVFNYFPAGCEN